MPPLPKDGPLFSLVERLPDPLFLGPLLLAWPYFALRYGGIGVSACANPGIKNGGWCNESKRETLELLGPYGMRFVPPHAAVDVTGEDDGIRAAEALRAAGLSYPVVAKPDIGRNGRGVKILRSPSDLASYLARFPRGQKLMLQKYVEDTGEAGVFYARYPGEARGRITSLTLKYFPHVTGDGAMSVRELILRDPRASRISDVYLRRHSAEELARVPAQGEQVRLVSVGNYVRGSVFVDGAPYITDAMTDTFDRIASETGGFYFGRFDVRFRELANLQAGEDFHIIELNGAGSQPTHLFDRRMTLLGAWRTTLAHWSLSFRIGAANRRRGARKLGAFEFLREFREELRLLANLPDEE
jgi:hypothetical protein